MPESPLSKSRPPRCNDLEALIAARAKDETETETGFRRRMDREEKEYQAASQQLAGKFKVDDWSPWRPSMRGRRSRSSRPTSAIPRRARPSTPQTKQQVDDQFKKEQRRAKKAKEETGWQALTVFEGTRDEGIKWRRATEANWSHRDRGAARPPGEAEFLLKRCGRLARGHPRGGRRRSWRRGRPGRPWRPPPAEVDAEATEADDAARGARASPPSDDPLIAPPDRPDPDRGGAARPRRAQAPQVLADPRPSSGRSCSSAAAWPPGWPSDRPIGWTVAGIAGGVVADRRRRSGPISAWPRWPGPRSCATPSRSGSRSPTPSSSSSRTRTGSRTSTRRSSRSSRSGGPTEVREAEETMARIVAEAEQRRQEQRKAADEKFPATAEQIRQRRDERPEEGRREVPAPDRRHQEEVRPGQAGARRVVRARSRRPPSRPTTRPGRT